MKKITNQTSLYVTLGIIIISTVIVIMSLQSTYSYISTKSNIIHEMKRSSQATNDSLKKNITNLILSYSINEYDNLIQNEMEHQSHFSIVVEDYNMGKILGESAYISGKIRGKNGGIVDYDSKNDYQTKQLEVCCYSDKDDIVNSSGDKIGSLTIYISNGSLNEALNKIIRDTIIYSIAISLLLIISLFITIRFFILKPVSNIISVISNSDKDGIPIELIPNHGAAEISALSTTMNNMVSSIRGSRIKLKEQHEELKERDDQLLTLSIATEQSPVSILICNSANIIDYVNPQFEKTSGHHINDVVGRSIEFLFEFSEQDENQIIECKESLVSNNRWIGEITPLTKEGVSYNLRISVSPISSEDKLSSHNIYVAEDITQHKRNEEILRNSQKMDAVGQLTGGVAHDFNNLLGIILGNLELLKMDKLLKIDQLEKIDSAIASTVRGAQLTRKLLNFSRQDHKKQELTKINSFIRNLHELISKSVTAVIKVEVQLEENLWSVEIDSGDLEDAVLNLSLNARDAMPEGGVLIIETANKSLDVDFVKQNPGFSVGDYVMLSVSDTGVGITKSARKKIFDPFFSTKEFGKGTGLGLSMVYGFVKRSNGHILLYSEEGHGSSFHIYLPRAHSKHDEQNSSEKCHKTVIELPRGNEKVLIVDDEKALLLSADNYLRSLGYQTYIANSGEEALEILKSEEEIELIFSDVIMPGIDGFELANQATNLKPNIKVLLTSGFTSKQMSSDNDKMNETKLLKSLLNKPYNLRELAEAVRSTIDG